MIEQQRFFNKAYCTIAANRLRYYAKFNGLEDLDGINPNEIVVSKSDCEMAADLFESAREKGGEFYCNIIKYPLFTYREIEVILQYL